MPPAKTEVALQFSECCAAETALQHWLFCSAEVIWTKGCAAANEKLHCNIEKAALQESGAFLPLSCGFQAPTFMHPRLGPAERVKVLLFRYLLANFKRFCLSAAPPSTKWCSANDKCSENFCSLPLLFILITSVIVTGLQVMARNERGGRGAQRSL